MQPCRATKPPPGVLPSDLLLSLSMEAVIARKPYKPAHSLLSWPFATPDASPWPHVLWNTPHPPPDSDLTNSDRWLAAASFFFSLFFFQAFIRTHDPYTCLHPSCTVPRPLQQHSLRVVPSPAPPRPTGTRIPTSHLHHLPLHSSRPVTSDPASRPHPTPDSGPWSGTRRAGTWQPASSSAGREAS